ncbi:MAG: RNA polymerase sigma-70 factor [Bacteroidales bacterium]|nr:RNA polymerase sigma-70 factor [Bacteroidales bacterium]
MENMEDIILQQLKKGNEEAYRYIYRHHYALLCHIAREYVNDAFTAETIVGDTIFHIWEIHETLDIRTSLRSYLVKAVRNRCLDFLQLKREQTEVTFSMLEEEELQQMENIDDTSVPLGKLLEQELEQEIRKAIDKIPAESKKVFLKSRFEKKKYEEIAQELGISVNTVKYHIKQALALLNKELGKYLLLILWVLSPP